MPCSGESDKAIGVGAGVDQLPQTRQVIGLSRHGLQLMALCLLGIENTPLERRGDAYDGVQLMLFDKGTPLLKEILFVLRLRGISVGELNSVAVKKDAVNGMACINGRLRKLECSGSDGWRGRRALH